MPTAAPPSPNAPSAVDAALRDRLGRAAGRIRLNDVLTGVLLVAGLALGYVAAVIVADRYLDLPAWVRQLGFVGLLVAAGVAVTRFIVRPLRRDVNPLFAAKRVEETVPDAKNGIVNYVDLEADDLPATVRAVVAARAAKQFDAADMGEAFDSKPLVRAGAVVAVLVLVLAGLFLLLRPAQFLSLFGRAVNPFSAGAIASRTELVIVTPAGGDAVFTAGTPVYVGVTVNGRIPPADGPDRVRVLLRYTTDDANFEELPLEKGETNRDWAARVPDHLVRNGFWYRVLGGDGATPEFRVQVRSRPMFTAYSATYEYPEYLRLKPETVPEPQLEGYRGTRVTLTAKANRDVKSGRLLVAGNPTPILGEVAGDSLRFRLTLAEAGSYRLFFTATTDEENTDPPAFPIRILSDQPPTVTITAPADAEVSIPTTGTLAIDGTAGDDFGVATMTLKLRTGDGKPLAAKPYQNGKSFRREADGTFPYAVEYKDSIPLAAIKTEAGTPANLKPGDVLEYWLEAADNCTEPGPQVGKSAVQRVKVAAPPPEPTAQAAEQKKADDRKQADAKHAADQKQKLDKERRDPRPQPRGDPAAEPKPEEQPKPQPKEGEEPGGQKQPGAAKPTPGGANDGPKPETPPPIPMPGDPMANPMPMPGDPSAKPMPGGDPMPKPMPGETQPMPGAAGGGSQQQKNDAARKEADRVEQELKKQQPGGDPAGEKKPGGDTPPAGDAKPMPGGSQPDAASETKPDPSGAAPDAKAAGKPSAKPGSAKPDPKELANAAKDLASNDPAKQEAARKKLDDMVGPDARKQAEQTMKDLKSDDPTTRQAAEKTLDAARKEMQKAGQKPPEPTAAEKAELKKAAEDMASGDPKREQAGRDKLDQMMGKDAREKAEQLANDLQSNDPATKAAAEEKLKELQKQAGGGSPPKEPTAAEKQQLQDAAKDLASDDPKRQAAGRKKLDEMVGEDARKEAEKLRDDLKSGDAGKKAAAEKKLDEMQKQAGGGQPKEPTAAEKKELQDAAKDLTSPDPAKQAAAQKKLDEKIGEDARKQAEQLSKDLQSGDKAKQDAAQRKLDEMAKQAGGKSAAETKKEIEKAAEDIASGDPKRQEAGRDKLDKMMGKDARQKAEQMANDLKSKDPATKAAAEKKLDEMQKQAGGSGQKEPTAAEKKELQDAAKDLASDDPKRQEAGRKKLDEMVGEDARKEAEKLRDDLKSGDAGKKAAAEKKLDDMQKQAAGKKGAPQEPTAAEKKELQDAAKDLNSPDPAKQATAQKKLDEKIGEDARKEAEQLSKDLQSGDQAKQEAAAKKLNDMAKQAAAKDKAEGKAPSEAEKKDVADAAKDMSSPDPKQQKAGADKFDKTDLGKDLAKGLEKQADAAKDNADPKAAEDLGKAAADLQKQMDDLKSGDPKKAEEAAKNLRDLANKMNRTPGGGAKDANGRGAGGATNDPANKPIAGNDAFGKRASELQLQTLKEARKDKELLKKLGYTEQDYDRFLKGFEEAVKQEKAEKEAAAKAAPPAVAASKVNVNEASGTLDKRGDGTKTNPAGAGAAVAPPGYGDVQRRFTAGASKLPPKDDKK